MPVATRISISAFVLALMGSLAQAAPPVPKKKVEEVPTGQDYYHVDWAYAGDGAPENWGKLHDSAICGEGKRQSPIDIRGGNKADLEPIRFNYRPTEYRITDNGHTEQVDVGEGNSIVFQGREYQLVQLHFHHPSENRINGKAYDMVIHFVHQDFEKNLAVVGVLIEKGSEHPVIQTLWNYMPLKVGMSSAPPNAIIDLTKLLPEKHGYYTFRGSLTTPPCSENVRWVVMKNPIQISQQQIDLFVSHYPYNARPVQPANDRRIFESP
jgi:carbonic anhydrase